MVETPYQIPMSGEVLDGLRRHGSQESPYWNSVVYSYTVIRRGFGHGSIKLFGRWVPLMAGQKKGQKPFSLGVGWMCPIPLPVSLFKEISSGAPDMASRPGPDPIHATAVWSEGSQPNGRKRELLRPCIPLLKHVARLKF